MKLLVTRPQADAVELIEQLEGAGHEVCFVPLLEIKFHHAVTLPATKPQAVLITSANGARGLGRLPQMANLKNVLAVTVGASSAQAAGEAGFNNVRQAAPGDVGGVIDFVRGQLVPQGGPLLYASGSKTSGDLVGQLQQSGFIVDRVVLYQADPIKHLPHEVVSTIKQGQLDGVLLYSPRTAKVWLDQTGSCLSMDELANIKHYCLSENVARIIDQGLGKFSDTIICKEPNTPSMLQAVSKAF